MKKTKLALIGLGLASSVAFASDFQLGYINVDRVFAEAKPAKAIQQALKDKYAPQQAKLQTMNTTIVKEQNEMQAIASKAPAFDKLSKADQSKLKTLETQYQKDQANFQQQYMAFQQSLQKSQELALSLLMTKTNGILKDLSDKKGYDLVLTSNQLVYAKAKYDVTDQVMDQLNTIDTTDIIKQINNPAPVAPMGTPAAAAAPAAKAAASAAK
jgi:outer membrane protein